MLLQHGDDEYLSADEQVVLDSACGCNSIAIGWSSKTELGSNQSNQINYFIVRLKVDQRAGQLSLPHLGITKTEKIELKHKTDEQISPVNGLEPWDQSDSQKQTKVEDKIFWKGRFWAQSETVKKWWKVIAECSKLNRHVRMMVAERGMNDSDEEFWVM